MSEEIKLDEKGSYMATALAEKLELTPQRAARFAFMLTVITLAKVADPRAKVERVLALLDRDDEIPGPLPRYAYRDLVMAVLRKMGMNGSGG